MSPSETPLRWRHATSGDAASLARLNLELIEDEGHGNPMRLDDLEERMRAWLDDEYTGIFFVTRSQTVAYALFRENEGGGIYLRQFFVARSHRRKGIGRAAVHLLVTEIVPPGTPIAVDVLVENTGALAFWHSLGFNDYAKTLLLSWKADGP